MFAFAGRRPNMELQLPYVADMLLKHPDVEYHLWDLARTSVDSRYLQSQQSYEQFGVFTQFAGGGSPWGHFNDVYRHYAHPQYEGCRFIKLDDDVVFFDSKRIQEFIDRITPGIITSAQVINNGACTQTFPSLWKDYNAKLRRSVQLLNVHRSREYALMAHQHFFDHWMALIQKPIELEPTEDWLSINFIGYDYPMAKRIAELLETPSPRMIAGRPFRGVNDVLGDEGLVNTLPRQIATGFVAAHLYFGPQTAKLGADAVDTLRSTYTEIMESYRGWK